MCLFMRARGQVNLIDVHARARERELRERERYESVKSRFVCRVLYNHYRSVLTQSGATLE